MPAIGDQVPDATVTVVLIGVPGACTPVCSDFPLPGPGIRPERHAAIIRDGVITSPEVEERFVDPEVSSAEAVPARL